MDNSPDHQKNTMSLGDHLDELRSRVIRSLIAVGVIFIGCWIFRDTIMSVLIRPHALAMQARRLEGTLKFQSYLEPTTAQLKACMIVALILASPWLIYQMWSFVAPGLYGRERRVFVKLGAVSLLCFVAGVGFGYFVFIPMTLRFLLAISGPAVEPVLMIESYLSLLFLLTFALGALFQMPIVMFHLVRWDIVSVHSIQHYRKYAIVGAFALSAVLTPPEPFTQVMMAIPLVVLYDVGALAAAPSRKALLNLGRFAGSVLLIGSAIVGFFFLVPVGNVISLEGEIQVGDGQLESGQSRKVRRGEICTVPQGSVGRLTFGPDSGVLIRGPADVRVHGKNQITLQSGTVLLESRRGTGEVRTEAGRATMESGRAEFNIADEKSLTVSVFDGEVKVRSQGRDATIESGRTASFHPGGRRMEDVEEREKRWQEMEKN